LVALAKHSPTGRDTGRGGPVPRRREGYGCRGLAGPAGNVLGCHCFNPAVCGGPDV